MGKKLRTTLPILPGKLNPKWRHLHEFQKADLVINQNKKTITVNVMMLKMFPLCCLKRMFGLMLIVTSRKAKSTNDVNNFDLIMLQRQGAAFEETEEIYSLYPCKAPEEVPSPILHDMV